MCTYYENSQQVEPALFRIQMYQTLGAEINVLSSSSSPIPGSGNTMPASTPLGPLSPASLLSPNHAEEDQFASQAPTKAA